MLDLGNPEKINAVEGDGYRILVDRRVVVLKSGEIIRPPPRTWDLMIYFMEQAHQAVISKDKLVEDVWQFPVSDRAIYQGVQRLRRVVGHNTVRLVPLEGYVWYGPLFVVSQAQSMRESIRGMTPHYRRSLLIELLNVEQEIAKDKPAKDVN